MRQAALSTPRPHSCSRFAKWWMDLFTSPMQSLREVWWNRVLVTFHFGFLLLTLWTKEKVYVWNKSSLQQVMGHQRPLTSVPPCAPAGGHHPGLCWFSLASREKNQKQPNQPTCKMWPETQQGVERHVWTWRRGLNCPKSLIPGWYVSHCFHVSQLIKPWPLTSTLLPPF